jgi:hypothetical protein
LLRDFLEAKTEAAFAVLVRRHGPMVWSVCASGSPRSCPLAVKTRDQGHLVVAGATNVAYNGIESP